MLSESTSNSPDPYAAASPPSTNLFDTVLAGSSPATSLDATAPYVASSAASTSKPPQIGRYDILSEIARGGMGVVYKAFDRQLDRLVALKLIKSGELADADQIERFQTEAKAAAQLDHPGIVQVYEVGQVGNQHFMAMAFIDGQSLWQEVKESPLAPKRAAKLMQQVAEAVQYAHDRGIVHRDLKPQNILLTKDGQPKVTDFGLAKRQQSDSSLTETGQALGTPSYMPPEQAQGKVKQIGPLSDVYSLGATLYCLVTGRPPFQAATQLETMLQVVDQEPVSLKSLNRAVSVDLETICLRCLEKDPGKRYATAGALASDLGRYLTGEPIQARRVSNVERGWRWCRRNPVVASLSSAAVLLLVTVATVSTLAYFREAELVKDKDTLIGEKTEIAGKEKAEREKAETRATELRIELAKSAFAHGVSEYEHGHPWNASRDSLRALALLPANHNLRPAYLRVAWDHMTRSGRSTLPFLSHAGIVYSASFSPDGTRVVTASHGGTARVWDAQTGASLGEPLRHVGEIFSASFSPDGTRVVTASGDQTARLWDAETGAPLGEPLRHAGAVSSASFSLDGTRVLTSSFDQTARLWDAETAAPLENRYAIRS